MRWTYNKSEKLKSKKLIEQLFAEGKTINAFPLKLVYLQAPFDKNGTIKAGVSVGKHHFRKAVDRNRIKRLMREVYRHNKPLLFNNITTQYALMILYIGKEIPPYNALNKTMNKLLNAFVNEVSE